MVLYHTITNKSTLGYASFLKWYRNRSFKMYISGSWTSYIAKSIHVSAIYAAQLPLSFINNTCEK